MNNGLLAGMEAALLLLGLVAEAEVDATLLPVLLGDVEVGAVKKECEIEDVEEAVLEVEGGCEVEDDFEVEGDVEVVGDFEVADRDRDGTEIAEMECVDDGRAVDRV